MTRALANLLSRELASTILQDVNRNLEAAELTRMLRQFIFGRGNSQQSRSGNVASNRCYSTGCKHTE